MRHSLHFAINDISMRRGVRPGLIRLVGVESSKPCLKQGEAPFPLLVEHLDIHDEADCVPLSDCLIQLCQETAKFYPPKCKGSISVEIEPSGPRNQRI